MTLSFKQLENADTVAAAINEFFDKPHSKNTFGMPETLYLCEESAYVQTLALTIWQNRLNEKRNKHDLSFFNKRILVHDSILAKNKDYRWRVA